MDAPNIRAWLVEQLTPILPSAWRYVTTQTDPGNIDTPYVFVSHKTIEREPSAPQSQHRLTFTITVVSPLIDYAMAEGPLGDDVEKLLYSIDKLTRTFGNLQWSKAEKIQFLNRYLAFEIDVLVITEKTESE